MSSVNYENQILDAIQTIVNNAVETAGYDRTIKAMIVRCEDQAIGKYLVKYQNSSFYAYTPASIESTYSDGTMVYVLIPGNDMSQTKTILGTVEALGANYTSAAETESGYEVVGNNIITSKDGLNLCSYKSAQIKTLYDYNETDNILAIDLKGIELYSKGSDYIICGANFRTALTTEQKSKGDYGIGFDLDFSDNATGEVVTKTYVVNVNKMQGNPYNLTKDTRQVCVFEADGDNFIRVNKIYIYERNFPITEEGHQDDIFISSIELNMANELSPQEISSNGLVLLTAKGSYFRPEESGDATREIKAQVRIKGKIMDSDSKDIEYYWFKENNAVDGKSLKYERHGGAGWECLNAYNETIEVDDKGQEKILRSWIPAGYVYETIKMNNIATENKFKCVAIYNDIAVSKEITIYNLNSQYKISIESDSGIDFYYDLGYPTLTCKVNGEEKAEYKYIWSVTDNYNNYDVIPETTERNEEYNAAVTDYNKLVEQIKQEDVLSKAVAQQMNKDLEIIESYEKVTRVEKNTIYNLHVNTINSFSIYKCSVYNEEEKFLGTASITLTNSLTNTNDYSIIITEGEQVFKYNENGVAPNNHSNEKPQIIYPLSFKIFDNKGQEIDKNAILLSDISWTVPSKSTLIKIDSSYQPTEEKEDVNIYTGYDELNFDIEQTYSSKKSNNTIQLAVKYKDKMISAVTNLTFTKTGEIGTNGTEYICKIVPNTADGSVLADYPMITIDDTMAVPEGTLNYLRPKDQSKNWFKVQLWHNGERIFNNIGSGITQEDTEAEVKWEILKNNYDQSHYDDSNIIINGDEFDIDIVNYSNPANIVKCSVTIDGVSYYATMPVIISRIKDDNYKIKLVSDTGYQSVMYTTDGQSPAYNNLKPFTLEVLRKIDGLWEDVSLLEKDFRVNYDWNVLGETYRSKWQSEQNLIAEKGKNLSKERNEIYYKPKDTFDGLCVNNGLSCLITDADNNQGCEIYIPVHLYLNRYGNSAMNGWDGNSIDINEDEGLILAPQVGAGKKTQENGFTGVFMGQVQEADKKEAEFGLYGYNNGERTIALSAEDGSARFGKTGAGQIVMDPSQNTAVLRSGDFELAYTHVSSGKEYNNSDLYFQKNGTNYVELKRGVDYNVGQTITDSNIYKATSGGSGLEIDLTDPHIRFGSGKFRVDFDGSVHASEYATIFEMNEVKEVVSDLEESVSLFEVTSDANSTTIPCNSLHLPSSSINIPINFSGTFKGKPIKLIEGADIGKCKITISGTHTGLTLTKNFSQTAQRIVVSANNTHVINDLINDYTITFEYYQDEDNTYTVTQQLNVILAVQGADGAPGEQGPVGPAGKDGTSVTVKGSYDNISLLLDDVKSGKITPVEGDSYIVGNNLFIYTNEGQGSGKIIEDWKDVGQFKGLDAKRCFIIASVEIFRSNDGGKTYTPSQSVLTPYFQSVNYQGWGYSTDGGATFTDVSAPIPAGLSINSSTKQLTIQNGCELFNTNLTLVFKCRTNDTDTYDTITVSKIKDGVDGKEGPQGQPGKDGKNGNGIKSTNYYYKTTTTQTAPAASSITSTSIPTMSSTDKFLWQKEVISYTEDGIADKVSVYLLAIWGNDGISGVSPYSAYLTNESQTFAYGTAKDITTQLFTYQGATEKKVTIKSVNGVAATTTSTATGKTGMNFKVSSISAIEHPVLTFSSTTALAQTQTEQLPIVFRIDGESADRTLYFSYSSTTKGATGTAASLVDISPSSQVFKSTDGGNTFTPDTITLTPRFQTVTYNKWQYSIDGGVTWLNVTSGSNGLTISNNNLIISKDSDLYTRANTSVSFKCISSTSSIYDTITIVKLYDVVDIQVGGRNLLLQTNQGIQNWGFNLGDKWTQPDREEIEWLHQKALKVTAKAPKETYTTNWRVLYYNDSNIQNILDPDSTYVLTFDSTNLHTGMGIQRSNGKDNLVKTQINKYETRKDENGEPYYHMTFVFTTVSADNFIRADQYVYIGNNMEYIGQEGKVVKYANIKIEQGNKETAWSAAPEDFDEEINTAKTQASEAKGEVQNVKDAAEKAQNRADEAYDKANGASSKADSLEGVINDNKVESTLPEYCIVAYEYNTISNGAAFDPNAVYYSKNGSTYTKVRPNLDTSNKVIGTYYTKKDIGLPPANPSIYMNKPAWEDGYRIYQRTIITYHDGTTKTSSWDLMDDYQTVDDKRYLDAQEVISTMRGKSKIFYNETGLYCYDNETDATSLHKIVLNNGGIVFGKRNSTKDAWIETTVWKIDGTFDAQSINVINLTADAIQNGTLTLGSAQQDGGIIINDDTGSTKYELNSQRFCCTLNNGGYVLVGKDIGFQVLSSNNEVQYGSALTWTTVTGDGSKKYENNINYYKKQGDFTSLIIPETPGVVIPNGTKVYTASCGNIFKVKQEQIDDTLYFGSYIQTVNINTTDSSSRAHRGVAFIARQ